MEIKIILAEYTDKQQADDLGCLLSSYAADPMGGNSLLDTSVRRTIAQKLSAIPGAFSILSYVDDEAAGMTNCFQGFSTFKCQPLINIHDIYVATEHRGLGLSQRMLARVEKIAKQRSCCKLTLEVLEGNAIARQAYEKFGFLAYELEPQVGKALFWEKLI